MKCYLLDPVTHLALPTHNVRLAEAQFSSPHRHVADSTLFGLRVSTVFLVLDHNYTGGEPLLFETMVFTEGNSHWRDYQARASTWAAAKAGHERVVAMIDFECRSWKSPTSRNVREGSLAKRRLAA